MEKTSKLILVVDDNYNFREILTIELKAYGFRVVSAENGKEGLDKAKKLKPDLMLLDIQMPEMDGIHVFMEMEKDPELAPIKIIFLTSYGEPREEFKAVDREFAKNIGAFNYLNKKTDMDKIVEEIKKALGL